MTYAFLWNDGQIGNIYLAYETVTRLARLQDGRKQRSIVAILKIKMK